MSKKELNSRLNINRNLQYAPDILQAIIQYMEKKIKLLPFHLRKD